MKIISFFVIFSIILLNANCSFVNASAINNAENIKVSSSTNNNLLLNSELLPINQVNKETPTINQDFKEDEIIVVLKHEYSSVSSNIDVESFKTDFNISISNTRQISENSNIEISKVTDLFKINDDVKNISINKDKFCRILSLTLKNKGKQNVLNAIKELEKREDVLFAEPSYNYEYKYCLGTNDPYFVNSTSTSFQWGLHKINMEDAWEIETGNSGVKVGILEKGISEHVDLNENLGTCWDVDSDSVFAKTNYEHGTHVAGIIGAVGNNNKGITGVAQNIEVCTIRGDFIESLAYAANQGIKILNASFRFVIRDENNNEIDAPISLAHAYAIANYDGLLIVAAGNSSHNNNISPAYPASYWGNYVINKNTTVSINNVISVAASTPSDTLCDFSNFGNTSVHIAAPGVNIFSTLPGNTYGYNSGTSMAAPCVSGVAALILSINPNFSPSQIRSFILNGASQPEGLNNLVQDSRRLNAYESVKRAINYLMGEAEVSVSGDFNGDNKDDVAVFTNYGYNYMQISVCLSNGNGFDDPKVWLTNTEYNLNNIIDRVAVGDINGDGLDDIYAMYNYGTYSTAIHYFKSQGSYFSGWHLGWSDLNGYSSSCVDNRFVSGDFNNDGYSDVASMYDYGNNIIQIHIFYSNGQTLNTWSSEIVCSAYNSARVYGIVSGNFRGDARDEIMALFNYGDSNGNQNEITYHCFWFNGSVMQMNWQHTSTLYPISNVVALFSGNFDGDNYDDVATLYNYGITGDGYQIAIHGVLASNWSQLRWLNTTNGYNASKIINRVSCGDYNNDGYSDVSAMYDYGNNSMVIHVFKSNGSGIPGYNWWYY